MTKKENFFVSSTQVHNPSHGGVNLNANNLMGGYNNTGGHTCIHSKINAPYELGHMPSTPGPINLRQESRTNLIQVSNGQIN